MIRGPEKYTKTNHKSQQPVVWKPLHRRLPSYLDGSMTVALGQVLDRCNPVDCKCFAWIWLSLYFWASEMMLSSKNLTYYQTTYVRTYKAPSEISCIQWFCLKVLSEIQFDTCPVTFLTVNIEISVNNLNSSRPDVDKNQVANSGIMSNLIRNKWSLLQA